MSETVLESKEEYVYIPLRLLKRLYRLLDEVERVLKQGVNV